MTSLRRSAVLLLFVAASAAAQNPVPRDTMPASMPGMNHGAQSAKPMASMAGALGIPMERMGSGTSWVPDAVSLPARHFMAGDWTVMLHGFGFLQYDAQSGPYGASQLGSLNWAMLMADHDLAGGRLQLRFMPSLDPWTVGPCGYPLLLQSGETCNGEPLVDWQHPHDFFMELGALYERPLTSKLALLLYAAPAGEPALGPVAFMHRPSAMDEPQVPLGHHWQDVTHTSFGVLTAGLFTRRVRLEGSWFNGHEPDEARWNLERVRMNSWSTRVTVNPSHSLSMSSSYGVQDMPEHHAHHHPSGDSPVASQMRRFSSSIMHGRRVGKHGQWASTLLYGGNKNFNERWSNSLLAETESTVDGWNTVFSRIEYVEKSAEDIQISGFPAEHKFPLYSFSLGYIRELVGHERPFTVGAGLRGTVNYIPRELESGYGSRTPVGGMIFLRVRPNHGAHASEPSAAAPHHHGSGGR